MTTGEMIFISGIIILFGNLPISLFGNIILGCVMFVGGLVIETIGLSIMKKERRG